VRLSFYGRGVTDTEAALRTGLSDDFKTGFRHHPAGVALIVAATPAGPAGLTVSSLASVSAAPPMLSFSVAATRGSAGALLTAERLDVVLLSADQGAVAEAFATPGAPRFTVEQGWRMDDGWPRLEGARATFHGRIVQLVPAGESRLALVAVSEVELGAPAEPLLYHDRTYRRLAP
jgi:flavin reductase (DIM6/NTAB) family NADH-FMN oxidoreductase RutF